MSVSSPTSPPTPTASVTRAWIGLMRTQRVILSAVEKDLKRAGLPPLGWYDVLLELSRAEGGRLRPYEIEARTLLAQHNLSRLLDRMETEAFVRRDAFDGDGRGRWIVITEAGRAMQTRMWVVYAASIQAHMGAKLTDQEAAGLADALAKLSR
ncbi:helix-turn-helix domain-containing protein [Methylobacterium sp. 17Sr1-1]|uniref:MarR family winged helix-turn-helix transcriptional regulator n=1 Tax=Methylobacterium sp. 17Sr1-1 TaxID=2202826 RepID=UPI000D6EE959|nr:helix-turn-helix domain-containing protein [Methylobacterium sp. 17Sr1-1]AWN51286.1 MarR family transcriptional regulator [Methylobacterium sp. 17Sr1-1]